MFPGLVIIFVAVFCVFWQGGTKGEDDAGERERRNEAMSIVKKWK